MPDHSPSTDERASLAQLSQSSLPLECTSHLGFGLGSPHGYVRILNNRHGLIETRECRVVADLDWLPQLSGARNCQFYLESFSTQQNIANERNGSNFN